VSALEDIAAERLRQIEVEGWTPEHDDDYVDGQMARAAASYALGSTWAPQMRSATPTPWPWDVCWWKPTTPRRDLIKAGALIVAEIERLDRLAHQDPTPQTKGDREEGR
jgi:hypothetical protein